MQELDDTEVISRPEVHRQPERAPHAARRRWLWLVALCVAAAGSYFAWPRLRLALAGTQRQSASGAGARERRSGVIPVGTAIARRSSVDVYLNGLGIVTPIYTVTVKSRVDGQLMEVLYKEGQTVQKDDLLIQIDPRPYEVQLAEAQGQMSKDQAVLANARTDLARYQKLWSQNAIPQQQLATQQALVTQYDATIQSDEAQINAARLNLTYCRITAPITGRVGLRLTDPGNIVHANDNTGLVVITQLDPISVIFTIAEDQLPAVLRKLRAGQHLTVEAWDREIKNKLAVGSLVTVDNEIDPTTGTLKLRAEFDNRDNALFPNQFVNARMLVERKSGATVVPPAAIQRGAQSAYVYVVQPDHTVAVRPVNVGTEEGDTVELTSGVAPGDVVVTDGVDKLQPGAKVTARAAGGR